ncbi:NUDIX hydrolase [Rubripirellula reticaptiva]|uniref:Putative NUDIX hydrolase n=1 Tax=Rubripirellula reticaptiva TaxID=2528013 RepID=A0A5C6EGU7_9BACT|nr:CoA pyrophosphatase [Rubripirellula reticaptiva]TWU48222.1 putative NUDIX hydrolase [Rubripirellula reticaptiva]
MSDENLGKLIERLLSQPSVPRSCTSISPTLSYGRHRGPPAMQVRIAAVAVTLYRDDADQWTIPLTLRPTTLAHHGGQISLPGGQVDAGETIRQAALREFEEELGVPPNVRTFCGQLATQYVYASRNLVFPVVMVIDSPNQDWRPDPIEVAEVVTLPLSVLLNPHSRIDTLKTRSVRSGPGEVGTFQFRARAIRHRHHEIWGATGMILDQLAQILLPYRDLLG